MLPSLTRSTPSTEPTARTWSVSRTSRGWLHNRLRQTKRRMTFWSHSTQRFRPRSMLNFSRIWRRFRRDRTRRTASPSDKLLPARFLRSAAPTERTSRRLLSSRETSRETTNSRLPISHRRTSHKWPQVTPFAIARAAEFRPGPPPLLTSDEYTRVFNEVQSLGFITSATRTPEQTQIGTFWNGNIQDLWNEIVQTAALGHHLGLANSARLFALLNFGLADSTIALFEAKYNYRFWRPVTAIELAGDDGNPNTNPNPNWLPLTTKTAPDPSYPGAHSAISFAGAEVLKFYFGDQFTFDVASESLQGAKRHFTSFSAAAQEAGLSRIYAGQHFRTDHIAGKGLGEKVAESVVDTTLLPK